MHSHEEEGVAENLVFQFSPEAETYITEMFNLNLKPKAIKIGLVTKGYPVPPPSKLETFLQKLRAAKFGKEKLHLGTLEAWLIECSIDPVDERDAFVVSYEIDGYDEKDPRFRFAKIHNNEIPSEPKI